MRGSFYAKLGRKLKNN